MQKPHFSKALLHPKLWLTWLGFALWWLLVQVLPHRVQMWAGAGLGRLAARFSERRRRITQKNIDMCLPELEKPEREKIFRQAMESAGKAFFETGMAWFWPRWRLQRMYAIEGLEHLHKAREEGQGVVFLGMHFTTLDIGAACLNSVYSVDGFYRPHQNPVYDYIQRKGRERHNSQSNAIPRRDVRGIIRALRNGRVICYLPDQDYGRQHSEFVPIFNIPAATVTAPSHFARTGKAQVIPFTTGRNTDDSGYYVRIYPPLDIGHGDDIEDAKRINAFIESRIRENPGQYLWAHRRFKTRPDGEQDFYKVEHMKWVRRRQRRKYGKG